MSKKYVLQLVPPKTPISPGNVDGAYAASSSASQQLSRKSRCCGSVMSASRGLKPKNFASKPSMSSTTPRALTYRGSASTSGGTPSASSSSSEKKLTPLRPSRRLSQKRSSVG